MNPVKVSYEKGKLRQEIYVGQHHLVADEPIDMGGEDNGPSPFELLASSLGACTAITLRMYAQKKSWPLKNAEVTIQIERGSEATIFNRTIRLSGELSEEQKSRLFDIAKHCPVHKALSGKIDIKTSLEQ